jgi:phosphoribosylformylglycinamidine synthase
VRALVAERVVAGVHDCSEGGLAVAVAEMAISGSCGAQLQSPAPDLDPALAWFSESASRVVVAVEPARLEVVLARAAAAGVAATDLGVAGGDRLVAAGAFDVAVSEAATTWREAIPKLLGRDPAFAL